MKSIIFAKRNLKEYLKSPLMLFFTLAFPIIMFFVFQLIKVCTGATDSIVPMFAVKNIISSICVFSYAFVALNLSTQIAKDRTSAFQLRLQVSPMKPVHFFTGYFIPNLLITATQTVLCVIVGIIFGLKLNINLLFALLSLICISTFYICLGIIIGSLFNEKSCGGISSILVNATAIFSGMFFPLNNGTFKNILSALPFLPSVAIPQAFLNNNFTNFVLYVCVLIGYSLLAVLTSVLIFKNKLKVK